MDAQREAIFGYDIVPSAYLLLAAVCRKVYTTYISYLKFYKFTQYFWSTKTTYRNPKKSIDGFMENIPFMVLVRD